ncbi:hypothetical protein Nepgr_000645 [Nepenthes gracilis]|uniref:Uncharacterized protein n=1 Tax=Nepenthes gracilis TaxID=150966 RepID=A0AAD3RWP1_NEPGR|nr:hypothetical protein Nepgr_000645 [Nepenthes gracilis]
MILNHPISFFPTTFKQVNATEYHDLLRGPRISVENGRAFRIREAQAITRNTERPRDSFKIRGLNSTRNTEATNDADPIKLRSERWGRGLVPLSESANSVVSTVLEECVNPAYTPGPPAAIPGLTPCHLTGRHSHHNDGPAAALTHLTRRRARHSSVRHGVGVGGRPSGEVP